MRIEVAAHHRAGAVEHGADGVQHHAGEHLDAADVAEGGALAGPLAAVEADPIAHGDGAARAARTEGESARHGRVESGAPEALVGVDAVVAPPEVEHDAPRSPAGYR